MATKSKSAGMSALAAAQKARGRDPGGVIANNVVERIVNNSSREFQDYLSRNSGGNAIAAAQQAVATAPQGFAPAQNPAGEWDPTVNRSPLNDTPPALPWMQELMSRSGALGREGLMGSQTAIIPPLSADTNTRRVLLPDIEGHEVDVNARYDIKDGFPVHEDGSFSMGRPTYVMPDRKGVVAPPLLNPSPQQGVDPAMERALRYLGLI